MNLSLPRHNSLPNLIFFEPTEAFIEFLTRTSPCRQIVDVGAGTGFLSATLSNRGFKCLAIDIIERDEPFYPVHMLDATVMQFPPACVPIMARPCHNEWVVETIRNALTTCGLFLYVGLEHNVFDDLGDLGGKYNMHMENFIAGKEDEIVIKITNK